MSFRPYISIVIPIMIPTIIQLSYAVTLSDVGEEDSLVGIIRRKLNSIITSEGDVMKNDGLEKHPFAQFVIRSKVGLALLLWRSNMRLKVGLAVQLWQVGDEVEGGFCGAAMADQR
ncbi:hypothetical protein L6452_30374 [Arctium lappa]|uniref:Uncharacterized protein n=1 Tax=Arctium lappa TaxID=4217 RepID=A0ACB8ZJ95_ARCLA|nr:hypothetical protein L6452_30374 [Arctium lappa]